MKSEEMEAWRRDQRRQLPQQLHAGQHEVRAPVGERALQLAGLANEGGASTPLSTTDAEACAVLSARGIDDGRSGRDLLLPCD